MARILIATTPLTGHTMPALTIAQKLVTRGHQVYWYSGKAFRAQIEKTGATFKPVTSKIDWSEIDVLEWAKENIPNAERLEGLAQLKVALKQGFIDRAPEYLQDLLEIVTTFEADILLSDSFFIAGKLFYEKTGLPWATFGESCLTIASRDTAPFGMGIAPDSVFSGRWSNQILQWLVNRGLMRDVNRHYNNMRLKLGLNTTAVTVVPVSKI
jgi:UDP:flavonoid glycosyltransferase YjiC (YdhE family)